MSGLLQRLHNITKTTTSKGVTVLKNAAQDYMIDKPRSILIHAKKLEANLLERLFGVIDIDTRFSLSGTPQDISELEGLIDMLSSIPTGRQVLKKAMETEHAFPPQITFVPVLKNGNDTMGGRFRREANFIEIMKIDTSIPDMGEKTRLLSRILMASTLAHELQHSINDPKDALLWQLANNTNEAIVANVLCEMSARLTDDQVARELFAKYNLDRDMYRLPGDSKSTYRWVPEATDPQYIKYKENGIPPDSSPLSPEERKKEMKQALSGKSPRFRWYIGRVRQIFKETTSFSQTAPDFRKGVQDYLTEMGISMSFKEVMSCARQSKKFPIPMRFKRPKTRR